MALQLIYILCPRPSLYVLRMYCYISNVFGMSHVLHIVTKNMQLAVTSYDYIRASKTVPTDLAMLDHFLTCAYS